MKVKNIDPVYLGFIKSKRAKKFWLYNTGPAFRELKNEMLLELDWWDWSAGARVIIIKVPDDKVVFDYTKKKPTKPGADSCVKDRHLSIS